MNDIFITGITVNKVRNIEMFEIPLSANERKHLIITGRNGSGKTSLLEELRKFLSKVLKGDLNNRNTYAQQLKDTILAKEKEDKNVSSPNLVNYIRNIATLEKWLEDFGGTDIKFNDVNGIRLNYDSGNYILAYFDSKRNLKFKVPQGINRITFKPYYNLQESVGKEFIQFIVNMKADRSFAKDENEIDVVGEIDAWFDNFEKNLAVLFGDSDIKLSFDRKNYNFNVIEKGKIPYNLNQLSDGYSAILSIITELLLRMDSTGAKSYNVQGIVIIDEIETHLHIDLQKKILPFLTAFFPKVQFIVTTHSPFIISSISNAVICDLEKKIVTDDLSGYSYDTLIESYFDEDKYSAELKDRIEEYEQLSSKEALNEADANRLLELKKYVNDVPKFVADELAVKIQQIQLKKLNKK